jgi:DNA-binding transcriptional LysR family regulator
MRAERNLIRMAAASDTSPPTLSNTIRWVGTRFGGCQFMRTKMSFSPTKAGEHSQPLGNPQ